MSHKPPGSRKRKPTAKPKVIPALERPPLPAEFRPVLLQRIKGTRPNQVAYLNSMARNTLTLGLGSAGTGKSFMAIGYAAQELASGRISRVVLSRPMVQCGEGLGFLPGDLHAKVTPFLEPLLDALGAFFSKADVDKLIELGRVRIIPLELMRGHSHKDTIVVLDEGQNASKRQLDMAITRIDHGTKMILTGDENQSDVGVSPLIEMVRKLSKPTLLESMGVVRFTKADNMRSPFVAAACDRLGI